MEIGEPGIDEDIQHFFEKHSLPCIANRPWRQSSAQIEMALIAYTFMVPKILCKFFSRLAFLPVLSQSDSSLYGGDSYSGVIIYDCTHNLVPSALSDNALATPASSNTSNVVKSGSIIEFTVEYSFESCRRDWKMELANTIFPVSTPA